MTNCNGSSPSVISSTSCIIPVWTLVLNPFKLITGQSVFAKIIATNSMGSSIESIVGNGAMISLRYIPDAPLNICRDPLLSTTTQISILWDDGLYDGNSPVLDYRVSFD